MIRRLRRRPGSSKASEMHLRPLLKVVAAAGATLLLGWPLRAATRQEHLYDGLLTVLLRLVFVLYAEDRDLIPSRTDACPRPRLRIAK